MQILLGDKLLDCIDGNRLVNGASGAGILAASVTDTSADSRERILLLDESQCLLVFALGSLLQITLYRNVRRTGRLTRSRTGLVAVDPVVVAVIRIPLVLAPLHCIRKFLLRICNLSAVLGAELLSQSGRTCRAILHTSATCHTFLRIHMRHISGTRHIRRVKKL